MKKKLSLLIVAFMALAAYAGLNAWRTASSEVVYTFIPQKPSSGAVTDYTKSGEQTVDGVTWDVPGNWYATGGLRLGGKSLDKVDRVITGKTAIDKAVGKLTFNHGGVTADKLTLNSVTVTVASDADFNNVIESVTKSDMTIAKNTEGSFDIEPTSGEWPANSYYKFAFNISNSNSSNYAFVLKSIVFFGVGGQTEETKAVYLKPGVWNVAGVSQRYAAYLFKDGDVNTWVDFQSVIGSDGSVGTYYKADIPVSYTGMILVRMNGDKAENSWDNKWNQTEDIDITDLKDNTLYKITGWGEGDGANSTYETATYPESTDPDPQPEQVTWTVAGSNEALFGTAWAPALEANDMTLEDGVYKWEKENVTLLAGDVEFKVVKNHSWDEGSYPEGSNNYVQSIEVGGIYTFTITFNAETKDIRVAAVKTGGISTIGELNALANNTAFTFFGDAVVVAKPTAKYVYIADERGGSLIYDKNNVGTDAAVVGKTIATPWSGKVSMYNSLFEAIPDAALAVKDGEAVPVTYQEVDATYLTAENVNKVVKLKGLTITAIDGKYITFKQGDADVAGYNQFGLELSEEQVGKTYDVLGAIGRYNDNIQFQPISMEEAATPVTINSMYVVGELTDGWPDTEAGDWSMAKEMTKSADDANVWTLTVAEFEAEAKEYQYKATANGKYGDYELPAEGNQKYTFTEAGKYTLLFTANTEKHELTLEAKKIETEVTYTVAGAFYYGDPATEVIIFGGDKSWDPSLTANDMTKGEDNLYHFKKEDVELVAAGNVQLKVVTNHKWSTDGSTEYPKDNKEIAIETAGKYDIEVTFNPETKEVKATATPQTTPEPPTEEATYYAVGVEALWGKAWAIDEANKLTKGEDGMYSITKTGLTLDAAEYGYKVVKVVGDTQTWIPDGEGNEKKLAIDARAVYSVTLTLNPAEPITIDSYKAVATKTGEAEPVEDTWTVVGAFYYTKPGEEKSTEVPIFGEVWNPALTANDMTKGEDGIFYYKKTDVELPAAGNIALKVAKNHKWDVSYPEGDGVNVEVKIDAAGKYDIAVTFNPETKEVKATATPQTTPEPPTEKATYYAVGVEALWGKAWAIDEANKLTKGEDGMYSITKTGLTLDAAEYGYKVVKVVGDTQTWIPDGEGNEKKLAIDARAVYSVTLTLNPAEPITIDSYKAEAMKTGEVQEKEVILDEDTSLDTNETLEVVTPFTTDEVEVEEGTIITIDAYEEADALARRHAFRALAADDIAIKYKPEAGDDWKDAPVTVETNETGYQFEVTGAVATAINDRGFAIKANKAIVVTQVAVVTEVTPEPEPEPVYYAVGVKALWGVNDWTVDEANKLTLNGEGKYTITKTELTLDANTNYGYKVVKVVGEAQTWIPEGMGNEKNLTVTERAVYSVTLTLDPAEPLTADSYLATATKTGEADPAPDATISKVEIRGSFNGWDTPADGLVMAKQGDENKYVAELDLTDNTNNVEFKLVLNDKADWIGWGELELVAPEDWTAKQDGDGNNIVLKNASTGYKTYTLTATWTPGPVAKNGWKLEIAGKDERPAVPATITKVELRGEFTSWSDGEGVELTKQGETDTYAGVLDLSEITADQAFKLVINDKTYWIDFNHLSLVAPDGWLVKESGEVTEPAIILTNSSTGYKTYDITATWTPSPNAAAGWTLTVAGKDARPAEPATISKVEIRGEFTNWSDGEGIELTKQGDDNKYAGVIDLSEITADQAFKLVLNDKAIWLDYNHVELVAPEGWLSKEAGDVAEPAIILANATTGYKTYSVTATWSPSPDASANWKLEIAGKDVREPAPEPEANYYIVGSMTDWKVVAEDTYKLTLNENAEAGVTEYMKTIDFAAGAEFKVVKVQGTSETWYPDGMDNNYKITNASNYTVYFRPNGDGGEGWHYGYIYAVDNNPTGINALKVAIEKGAEVYTVNGQRVQNPTKGLYIVNGRKVVIK